ncbi:hypothetical protein PVAP13_3KG512100 [Panicum virgatum]|uniref:Uncharacterized protein n=1 Tax=Panicum virgatum TaxID=38727 RepID=A0A8T0V5Z3_PANVG|nr:hypothetical protein PVAP13_3KG512100 [Panicum virgatum]
MISFLVHPPLLLLLCRHRRLASPGFELPRAELLRQLGIAIWGGGLGEIALPMVVMAGLRTERRGGEAPLGAGVVEDIWWVVEAAGSHGGR